MGTTVIVLISIIAIIILASIKPVLGQGNMAVLGCFRSHAGGLSRGCRALLQSYGQL